MATGFIQRFKGRIAAAQLWMTTNAFYVTATNTITAHAGGTRAAAVALTANVNHITVCATLNDSVALPPAIAGLSVFIANDGAANAKVYAAVGTSDTIDGVAAATGVTLSAANRAEFLAVANGVWVSTAGVAST
jgi:hypothetical protein